MTTLALQAELYEPQMNSEGFFYDIYSLTIISIATNDEIYRAW